MPLGSALFTQTKIVFDDHYQFVRDVAKKINKSLNGENDDRVCEFFFSDDLMDEKVIRIRPCEMVEDEEDKSVSLCLRDFA